MRRHGLDSDGREPFSFTVLNPRGTRTPGARDDRSPALHLLVALLVALQLAGPVSIAFGEASPAPVSHLDHMGSQGDSGCTPFHDDALCLSCRLLALQLPHTQTAPSLGLRGVAALALRQDRTSRLPGVLASAPLHARAPPRI